MAAARRAAKKYLYRNVTSGYITPDPHYLSRSGLRGKKAGLCCASLALVACLSAAHLLVTCFILGVLGFDAAGPRYLTTTTGGVALVLDQGAALPQVRVAGPVSAFEDLPLTLSTNEVVLLSHGSAGSSVELSRSELRLSAALQVGAELQAADSSLVAVTNLEPVFMMSASSVSTATVSSMQDVTVAAGRVVAMWSARSVAVGGREVELFSPAAAVNLTSAVQVVAGAVKVGGGAGECHHLCACGSGRIFLQPCSPQRCLPALATCS